jgi:hypothetical protein
MSDKFNFQCGHCGLRENRETKKRFWGRKTVVAGGQCHCCGVALCDSCSAPGKEGMLYETEEGETIWSWCRNWPY